VSSFVDATTRMMAHAEGVQQGSLRARGGVCSWLSSG
jgi:hypothetical protein